MGNRSQYWLLEIYVYLTWDYDSLLYYWFCLLSRLFQLEVFQLTLTLWYNFIILVYNGVLLITFFSLFFFCSRFFYSSSRNRSLCIVSGRKGTDALVAIRFYFWTYLVKARKYMQILIYNYTCFTICVLFWFWNYTCLCSGIISASMTRGHSWPGRGNCMWYQKSNTLCTK